MIVETIVLPIVQKVLTTYITSVMAKRSAEKTRADLVSAVQAELRSVTDIRDEVATLRVAVTELNLVVKADRNLDWRSDDDALVIRSTRPLFARSLTVEKALHALQASVAERRRELGLPAEPEAPEPAEVELGPTGDVDGPEKAEVPEPAEVERQPRPVAQEPVAPKPAEPRPTVVTIEEDPRLVPAPTAEPRDPAEPSIWKQRVLALSEETRRERRQRLREGE